MVIRCGSRITTVALSLTQYASTMNPPAAHLANAVDDEAVLLEPPQLLCPRLERVKTKFVKHLLTQRRRSADSSAMKVALDSMSGTRPEKASPERKIDLGVSGGTNPQIRPRCCRTARMLAEVRTSRGQRRHWPDQRRSRRRRFHTGRRTYLRFRVCQVGPRSRRPWTKRDAAFRRLGGRTPPRIAADPQPPPRGRARRRGQACNRGRLERSGGQ